MARAARTSRRVKGKKRTFDMSKVEGGGIPRPGEYLLKVREVTEEEGKEYPYYKWVFEVADGNQKGKLVYHNTSHAPKALFNLKGILLSLGLEVPDEVEVDLDEMVDLEMMGKIEHEEFEGKPQARLVDHWPAEDAPEEEEKPRRRRRDEEEEKAEEPRSRRSRRDEEEEEPPRRRGSRREEKEDKISADDVADMNQDELEDLNKDHKLKIDFDDHKTLRKMRQVVTDALENKGLLAD